MRSGVENTPLSGTESTRLYVLRTTVLRTGTPSICGASEGRLAERHRAGYFQCPHKRQIRSNEIWTAEKFISLLRGRMQEKGKQAWK